MVVEDAERLAWEHCRSTTVCQRRWGVLCAVLLGAALVCVLDGLQALRRSEADLVELLPGGAAAVSGPLAVRNPARGDVQADFSPDTGALTFELDGFFAGYIFGSGMWRGVVRADAAAAPGRRVLRVRFRGTSARAMQRYPVCIYADEAAMRAASLSFIRRLTGQSPFLPAAAFCAFGLLTGLAVFFLGQRRIRHLAALGCGEVVAVRQEGQTVRLWCLLYTLRAPAVGSMCALLDMQGALLGEARVDAVRKGTLEMSMAFAARNVRPGCLARLRSRLA